MVRYVNTERGYIRPRSAGKGVLVRVLAGRVKAIPPPAHMPAMLQVGRPTQGRNLKQRQEKWDKENK